MILSLYPCNKLMFSFSIVADEGMDLAMESWLSLSKPTFHRRRLKAMLEDEVRIFFNMNFLQQSLTTFPCVFFSASFEVTVDGQLIHSKLSTNSFPDFEEVVDIVKSVAEGSKPQQVTKTQSAGCNIL